MWSHGQSTPTGTAILYNLVDFVGLNLVVIQLHSIYERDPDRMAKYRRLPATYTFPVYVLSVEKSDPTLNIGT